MASREQMGVTSIAGRCGRPAVVLTVLGLLIVAQRLHTYHEPPERDLAIYAVIGHELLHGQALYSDAIDQKPPAIYLTYALAERVVGYGVQQLFVLGVLAALLTMGGVYTAAQAMAGSHAPSAGLWAAAFWAISCSDLTLQANQPNTEVFLNATVIWAFAWWLAASRESRLAAGRFCAVGVMLGIASLYKQVVVAQALLLALAHLTAVSSAERRRALVQISIVAGIGVLLWSATLGWFFATGAWERFSAIMFTYNHWYAGSLVANLIAASRPENLFARELLVCVPLAVLMTAGMILAWRDGRIRVFLFGAALSAGVELSIALPGKFFAHYYQLWLAPLAVGAAWGLAEIRVHMRQRGRYVARGLGGLAVVVMIGVELPFYFQSADNWSRLKYGSDLHTEVAETARAAEQLLAPGERLYEWGAEPAFYFLTGRRPPTGVIHAWYTMSFWGGPIAETLAAQALADLQQSPPALVVLEARTLRLAQEYYPNGHPIVNWLMNMYVRTDGSPHPDRFAFIVHRDSALHHRIAADTVSP